MKKKLKNTLKRTLPEPVKNGIIDVIALRERSVIFTYDKNRFVRSYSSRKLRKNTQPQLAARITFHAHALEKGMSHADIRYGFGKSALENLGKCLRAYNTLGYSKQDRAYENALSVLAEYIALHESIGHDLEYLKGLIGLDVLAEVSHSDSVIGGVEKVGGGLKQKNNLKTFKELFQNRWSVREYADTKVDIKKIDSAISLFMKTPSICNRQSARVTVVTNSAKIEAALKVQGGMTGYALPPVLLMVTTDTSAFVHVTERNQVYIDGGLFSMSLLLALEAESLAACPLNAMLSVSRDKKMREILDIPKNENIIMFLSVGNFREDNKVPKSFRYDSGDVSRVVG